MFKIAVVGALAENYIDRCINSWLGQKNVDFQLQVVIDPIEGNKTGEKALKYNGTNPKINVKVNAVRQYAIPNFIDAFKLLNPSDDDILVMADADDWAYSDYSLAMLYSYYSRQPDLLLTHGSWISYPNPNVHTNNAAYSEHDFKIGIRRVAWRASHLRTFKYKLWKHLKDESLRDEKGEYFKVTWDMACILPLVEMAGFHRVKFVQDILYVYNQETPFNDSKLYLQEQMRLSDYIAALPNYSYMENL